LSLNLHIRQEAPTDYYAVENLTREAFWDGFWGKDQVICDEHLLVDKLRKCPSFVPELDFIAELNGEPVGHIIFSKSKIVDMDGTEHETLTFGPLSVMPAHQGLGVGKALMIHAFDEAKRLGYRAVIIFGHTDYYPRVGFRPAGEFGITTADGSNFDAFMALPLYEGALMGITGKYYIDPVYETLTQEDALEFDNKFPKKERHIPVSINILLDRLEPPARKALASRKLFTINQMSGESQRALSTLEGIDENAIKTIRQVMAEHGMKWGRGDGVRKEPVK